MTLKFTLKTIKQPVDKPTIMYLKREESVVNMSISAIFSQIVTYFWSWVNAKERMLVSHVGKV